MTLPLPLSESDAPPTPVGAGVIEMPDNPFEAIMPETDAWASSVPLTTGSRGWSDEDRPVELEWDRRRLEAWYGRRWEARYVPPASRAPDPLAVVVVEWRRAHRRHRRRLSEQLARVMAWAETFEREAGF